MTAAIGSQTLAKFHIDGGFLASSASVSARPSGQVNAAGVRPLVVSKGILNPHHRRTQDHDEEDGQEEQDHRHGEFRRQRFFFMLRRPQGSPPFPFTPLYLGFTGLGAGVWK